MDPMQGPSAIDKIIATRPDLYMPGATVAVALATKKKGDGDQRPEDERMATRKHRAGS